MMTSRETASALDRLKTMVSMVACRAVVRMVGFKLGRQMLQVEALKDELIDDVEHFQNYGFGSRPKVATDTVTISLSGNREQVVALVVDDRNFRVEIEEGEVIMFDDQEQFVRIFRDRIEANSPFEIRAIAPTVRITADNCIITANVQIEGDVDVTGNISSTGTVENNGINIGSTHTHPHGDPAGNTSPPNP